MNIVCFHLNQLGDLLFSLPALKCLRERFPEAVITSVVRPGAVEIMEGTGLVDRVVPRYPGLNLRKCRLARYLMANSYDLAIVFSQSAECALLAHLCGAPERVGFVNTTLGSLLTRRVAFKSPPSTDNDLRLVEAVGCKVTQRVYARLVKPTPSQVERAGALLSARGVSEEHRIAALGPGTSKRRALKEWTPEGFAAVGRHLTGLGYRVVVLGTEPVDGIVQGCPEIVDLSGRTNLGEAAAVLARCDALVAVDSGILHLCAALGKPVVGLYGPSDPSATGPQGEGHVVLTSGAECSPCGQGECKYKRKCMTNIDPSAVIAAVETILNHG